MPLWGLFRRSPIADSADKLYLAAVAQARRPEFYLRCGVPDTVAGRFEMIALHVFLLLHRLKGEKGEGAALAQALFDAMFADMDRNLREMGTGDLSVGRKIRRLAEAFYGRIAAYDAGLAAGEDGLAGALRRNLYGAADEPPRPPPSFEDGVAAKARVMAAYARREAESLRRQELDALLAGRADFGPPPAAP